VSGGEIAALLAAAAFLLLVGALIVLILRLCRTVDAATRAIEEVTERTGPLLDKVDTTVDQVNAALGQARVSLDEVNAQLARVDTITGHAQQISGTIANLTMVLGATATGPLVKVAALGYGLRRAVQNRQNSGWRSTKRRGRTQWLTKRELPSVNGRSTSDSRSRVVEPVRLALASKLGHRFGFLRGRKA